MDSVQSRLYETNDSEQEKNKKPAEVPLLFPISLTCPSCISFFRLKKKIYGTATLTSCVTLDKLLNLSMPLLNWRNEDNNVTTRSQ